MIGEQEAALWRQAEESADALDVYLDWLLIHDPIRGELLRMRMQNTKLTDAQQAQELAAWSTALGLDGDVCDYINCTPLPRTLRINADHIARIEPLLDQFPLLRINLDFTYGSIEPAFASPVMSKIRALSYSAMIYEDENYQSDPHYYFGSQVVSALCASPHVTQLEILKLDDDPGYECAKLIATVPFVNLRELHIEASIYDGGAIALASSPIIKTLRKLTLDDSKIGDAGALALAREAQLEELTITEHEIGAEAEAALRAMPSLKRIDLKPKVR